MPLFSDKLNNQGGFCYNIYIIKRDFNQRNVTDLQHALLSAGSTCEQAIVTLVCVHQSHVLNLSCWERGREAGGGESHQKTF